MARVGAAIGSDLRSDRYPVYRLQFCVGSDDGSSVVRRYGMLLELTLVSAQNSGSDAMTPVERPTCSSPMLLMCWPRGQQPTCSCVAMCSDGLARANQSN